MVKRFHLLIDAWNCKTSLEDPLSVDNFLKHSVTLLEDVIVHGPIVDARKVYPTGISGFISTSTGYITVQTFPENKEAHIAIYSVRAYDSIKMRDFIMNFFGLDLHSLRIVNISKERGSDIFCEEPGCTYKAIAEYQGRKLCSAHYHEYKDKHAELHSDDR